MGPGGRGWLERRSHDPFVIEHFTTSLDPTLKSHENILCLTEEVNVFAHSICNGMQFRVVTVM
jgi:hypothetical protein